jgi:hypothetical protein
MIFQILLLIVALVFFLLSWLWLIYNGDYWHQLRPKLNLRKSNERQYLELKRTGGREDRTGVISYSLYGNYQDYAPQLQENIRLISEELPTWQVRVYLSDEIPKDLQQDFLEAGAEIVVMKSLPGHQLALARFLPGKENLTFVSLDADDCFELSEEIKSWYQSNEPFGLFTTHQLHIPIMAGLWGVRGGEISEIEKMLEQYSGDWYGFDETFLLDEIWPKMKERGYWQKTHLPKQKLFWGIILGIIILFLFVIFWTSPLNIYSDL